MALHGHSNTFAVDEFLAMLSEHGAQRFDPVRQRTVLRKFECIPVRECQLWVEIGH